jgi:Arm DNA-binding domain
MQQKLTDLAIQRIPFQHPQITYWDTLLPGFGVRVGSRSKTFVLVQGKARKRITIGRYPVMTLQKARDAARLKIANQTAALIETINIGNAVDQYLKSISVKSRTHRDYTRLLNTYLLPALGSRHIEGITARDILAITDQLLDTPTECRHAHAAMQTFFNWCVPRFLNATPMSGLKTPTKPNHRDRILSDRELKRVWNAAAEMGKFGVVVRLIILTAARRGEISPFQTLNGTTVTFHDTKNRTDHTLPITPYMHSLFGQLQYTNGWSKNKAQLDEFSGVTDYVLHDLRRTTATNLIRLGTDPFLVERILNHSMPTLQKIYNRHDFTEAMREPLRKHEEWLLALVNN